jgi:LPXTG-motif cell wall-anchored protein
MSTCTYNITTGNVTVYQYANGGNVSNSGNVSIGNGKNSCGCRKKSPPPEASSPPSPAPTPTSSTAVKTLKKKTAVLSGAQPTHTLATTGAETSTPLTAGLIALGAGAALTLAGRRRQAEAA